MTTVGMNFEPPEGFKAYNAFELEVNVPKGLAGMDIVIPDKSPGYFNITIAVATCKIPFPGKSPDRHKCIMTSPRDTLKTKYPVTSIDSFEIIRSEEERYFLTLVEMTNCYQASLERGVPMHEIAEEFGGKTAFDMLNYFRNVDGTSGYAAPVENFYQEKGNEE